VPRGHLLAMFGVQRAGLLHGGGSCVLKAMGLLAGRQWYLVCNIFYVGNVDALSGKGFLGVLVEMNMLVLFTVGVLI